MKLLKIALHISLKKTVTNKNLKILKKVKSLKIENSDIWINEALFGFSQIKDYCDNLKSEGNLLEIGSGSGVLLSMLKEKYKNLKIEGIEPFGDGFSSLREIYTKLPNKNIKVFNKSFEEFRPKKKYDIVFCINVFEHLKDWKEFLKKVHSYLKKDGKLIILAPNYDFPFESHFKIPIIINKKITFFVFQKYINRFEKINNCVGLWESLNFVKKSQIYFECKKLVNQPYVLDDKLSIIEIMIKRFIEDDKLRKRQLVLGTFAVYLKKFGLLKLLKLFPRFIPYMKLILIKK